MAPGRDDVADTDDFFEMSLDLLCVAGFDGYLKRVNASWTRTLGWSAAELMGRPSVEFVHPDDRALTLQGRERLKSGREMGPLVNRYLCKDGSFRWVEWRSTAHADRALVYAAARDITEQKLAELRLAQAAEREQTLQRQLTFADRMASIGTLAGGVAHEINNPLASITANISMLVEDLAAEADQRSELLAMSVDIQTSAERIRKIVAGLMAFSRTDEERRVNLDLSRLLELATDITSNQTRHRARIIKDYRSAPAVFADEARLGQVFINLLVNAAQAQPEDSSEVYEIRVTTSTDAAGDAVVEISDNGVGIPAAVLPRIFDPFFTTKPIGVGTGLGLSVCHTIVTGMGGEIGVVSAPGRGSTFRVTLPAARPERGTRGAFAGAPAAKVSASVLIIDDEAVVGAALARVLRAHEVTVVDAAAKALTLLEGGRRFDVVFSDLMMPAMSGMELYDELTRRFPEVARRVVFITGGTYTAEAKAFFERVSNPRVLKPFEPETVRALIARVLAETGGADRPSPG